MRYEIFWEGEGDARFVMNRNRLMRPSDEIEPARQWIVRVNYEFDLEPVAYEIGFRCVLSGITPGSATVRNLIVTDTWVDPGPKVAPETTMPLELYNQLLLGDRVAQPGYWLRAQPGAGLREYGYVAPFAPPGQPQLQLGLFRGRRPPKQHRSALRVWVGKR